ncbi:MAG TPA: lytic transglycosylase domain-containing protein [Bryobacteraceae bacterium]|nr:lytic transglycosylase domain-containing protein [Bryobacteraceae bacterium]
MKALLVALAVMVWAEAGEYVLLTNGQRMHVDSHETNGDMVRLKLNGGSIEFRSDLVAGFEAEPAVAPPAATQLAAPMAVPTAPAPAQPRSAKELLDLAAERAGLPPAIVHSVAKAESAYQPNAVSPKGAIGLMQLMPQTAAALKADPYDPEQNATAGAMYLRELLIKYQDDPHQVSKALAAYNAGPGAVDHFNGIPPYAETRKYVNRVIDDYIKQSAKVKNTPSNATN